MPPISSPPFVQITSRSSQWFRRFRKAIEEHDREIVLEGPKQIRDSVSLGWMPLAIAWDEGQVSSVSAAAPHLQFEKSLFHELSTTRHSQGVLGLFERRRFSLGDVFANGSGLVMVLDSVQDPGNVGTMLRLAAAFEASGVVVTPGSADPFSQKAIRASAGSVLQVPVARAAVPMIVAAVRENRWTLLAATPVAGDSLVQIPPRAAIVFGNEGGGVSQEFLDVSRSISVRISTTVESLNVAAAAAILLSRSFEDRQRRG